MPSLHRAAWVLPIVGPPLRDGWVLVGGGRVLACGGPRDPVPPADRIEDVRYDEPLAILPGLVNAHTHLELSWMRGRVPPASSMPVWVSRLLAERRTAGGDPREPIAGAIHEMRASGTSLAGDVTNTLAAWEAIAGSDLSAAVFLELLGFTAADPSALVEDARERLEDLMPLERIRTAVVPHAPYSVSPDLMRAIARAADAAPISVHLGESAEEMEFLRAGTGVWRTLLEDLGAWSAGWEAPGCGPVEYLDRLGLVTERLVAVHAVQLDDGELARLADAGATVVTCPRSNRWVGAGTPPVERFYASGVRVAVGTDSLASVEDLNLFAELAAVRRVAPAVPGARLLRSATLDGAAALGFGGELGSIEAGKRAELIGVRVPPGIADVEEYLVSGVPAGAVRWLERGWQNAGLMEDGRRW